MTGTTNRAYKTLLGVLKKQSRGLTVADMTAKTALPLNEIQDLIPRAADEYSARLEVTASGEILYSFPRGFTSRYRGFVPSFRRFAGRLAEALKRFLAAAFKLWIMAMLVGYFVLFIVITLAAMVFVMAAGASSNNRNKRNSGEISLLFPRLLNLVFHFWFYSSLAKSSGSYRYRKKDDDAQPLYKKVFSFVFGDGDPNRDWEQKENMEVIRYLQSNKGVMALPEFMILTGLDRQSADREILACCAKYGGMPEAGEDGTVVYRFDPLLLSARQNTGKTGFVVSLKKPWKFSQNKKEANIGFALINGINLAFGAYFLYFVNLGLNADSAAPGSYLFRFVYSLLSQTGVNPVPLINAGLGVIPFLFSLLFWLVPALRNAGLKKKNTAIEAENRRKTGFAGIWENPLEVTVETAVKEMGAYSVPDVHIDERGQTVYTFTDLDREKRALKKYRAGIDADKSGLGSVVFDSGE